MPEIRMLAFDLDGTALLDDHKSFSARLLRDLDEAYEKGIEILPVTGRRFFMMPPALKVKQKWSHLLVCANGAEIRDLTTGRALFDDYIQKDTAMEIAREAASADIRMELSGDEYTYVLQKDAEKEKRDPSLQFHYETVIVPNARIVKDLSEEAGKINVIKIVLMPETEGQVRQTRRILKGHPVYASETGAHFFEISAASSNKGTGLEHACRMLGINPGKVMYAGDSDNDIAAMKTAGFSTAMGNAPEKIKKICMHTTEDNMHEGLALAMEKYLHLAGL